MRYRKIIISREQLYEELWTMGISKVAEKYNTPYARLKDSLKRANVPAPSSAYWVYLQMGSPEKAIKLPLPASNQSEVTLYVRDSAGIPHSDEEKLPEQSEIIESDSDTIVGSEKTEQTFQEDDLRADERLLFLPKEEREKVLPALNNIQIEKNGRMHPIANKFKMDADTWFRSDEYKQYRRGELSTFQISKLEIPVLCKQIFPESVSRIALILSTIFKQIDKLGGRIHDDLSLTVRGETITFSIIERYDNVAHVLTPKEQKALDEYEERTRHHQFAYKPSIRKYDRIPSGQLRFLFYQGKYVRDTAKSPLEDRLGEILQLLYEAAEQCRIDRIAEEEKERIHKEKQRKQEELRNLYNLECEKLEALINASADYETACRIRQYIRAVEAKDEHSNAEQEWLIWARRKADWYDPLVSAEDDVFGKREHTKSPEEKDPKKKWYW